MDKCECIYPKVEVMITVVADDLKCWVQWTFFIKEYVVDTLYIGRGSCKTFINDKFEVIVGFLNANEYGLVGCNCNRMVCYFEERRRDKYSHGRIKTRHS